MTDNEIVKVLECCRNGTCRECPYVDEGYCGRRMISGSLDLIKRQQAEIERLNSCVMSEEQVREIMKSQMHTVFKDIIEDATDKAIKEFADRIISYIDVGHLCSPTMLRWSDLSVKEMVERLAKEMVGADNG